MKHLWYFTGLDTESELEVSDAGGEVYTSLNAKKMLSWPTFMVHVTVIWIWNIRLASGTDPEVC